MLPMHVEASPLLHANQADEAFVRVGDRNRKLDFNDRVTLMYAKGLRYFEDEPVADATVGDLDLDFVGEYCRKIGYAKSALEYVRENKRFVTVRDGREQVSAAAILLFGKNPQLFFPRAFVRFIRYDGTEAKVGTEMNIVKDKVFDGRILNQVERAIAFVKDQMKEKTYLGNDGVFVTEEEYGEFVRTEIVVNAVAHRDYGIRGTDIQVKMFDDRLEVEQPRRLRGNGEEGEHPLHAFLPEPEDRRVPERLRIREGVWRGRGPHVQGAGGRRAARPRVQQQHLHPEDDGHERGLAEASDSDGKSCRFSRKAADWRAKSVRFEDKVSDWRAKSVRFRSNQALGGGVCPSVSGERLQKGDNAGT